MSDTQKPFEISLSLSTGSVVHVADTDTGIVVNFINPLIAPDDPRRTCREFDNAMGRNTVIGMSEEAWEALLFAFTERFKQKTNV